MTKIGAVASILGVSIDTPFAVKEYLNSSRTRCNLFYLMIGSNCKIYRWTGEHYEEDYAESLLKLLDGTYQIFSTSEKLKTTLDYLSILGNYKYLVQNAQGEIVAFEKKPYRNDFDGRWICSGGKSLVLKELTLDEINYTDKKPFSIDEFYSDRVFAEGVKNIPGREANVK